MAVIAPDGIPPHVTMMQNREVDSGTSAQSGCSVPDCSIGGTNDACGFLAFCDLLCSTFEK